MTRVLPVDQLVDERYEIRAALEQAASLCAYRAFDREVEVEVALWQIRDELFPDPRRRQGFVASVLAMRSVQHPNLRRMFDAGDADGVLYATCQLETDDGMLPRPGDGQALGDEALLHYTTSVVDALHAAHEAGYVHGRLIPPDIVHVAGLIKVGGVGIYNGVDLTAARGVWIGSERFIAPEVLSGQPPTPASDVYSLAVMVAELATGTHDDDLSITLAALGVDKPELAEVLQLSLGFAPERRPADAPALLELVASGLGYEPTTSATVDEDLARVPEALPVPAPEVRSLEIGGPDDLPTRQMRGLEKAGPSQIDDDLETMLEGHWDAGTGNLPAPMPEPVRAPPPLPAPAQTPPPVVASLSGSGPVPVPASSSQPVVQPREPARRQSPVMVSHKPKSEPGKVRPVRVPAIERAQPRVRPISDARNVQHPVALGNYAPPRQVGEVRRGSRTGWIIGAVIGAVLIVGGVLAAVLFLRGGGEGAPVADAGTETARVPDRPTPVVTTSRDAGARGPCPGTMVYVTDGDGEPYCIDRYESPGARRMPESGLSFTQAEERCRSRGAMLCTPEQWEHACRGKRGSSWPYGSTYRRGICNVKSAREVAATGSFPGCVSAVGLFDMSGNVAEWVQGKVVRGGSSADDSDGRCSRVVRRAGRSAAAFADVGFRCCSAPRSR